MLTRTAFPQTLLPLAGLLLVAAGLLLSSSGARADTGREVIHTASGPLVITARVQPEQPVIGLMHVAVTVDYLATGEPVENAEVTVVARPAEEGSSQQSRAINTPENRRQYNANLTIERAGWWTLEIDVLAGGQEGSASTELNVLPPASHNPNMPLGTAVFAAVGLVLVGGAFWVAYSARKAQAARQQALRR